MNTLPLAPSPKIPESAVAEASRWFALLHGPKRNPDAEVLFRKWCEASEDHEAAYDLVTTTWEQSVALPKPLLPLPRKWQRAGFRSGMIRAVAAVAAAMAILAIAAIFYVRNTGIRTEVGEQRTLTLADGTRVSLNTDTQIRVQYDEDRRVVTLKKGEALFEVASQPRRPFVVQANGREVTALGTAFVVRSSPELFSVILMEGQVAVTLPEEGERQAAPPMRALVPGERLVLAKAAAVRIDRPEVEKIIAWRRGRIELDRTPLYLASAELNRYSAVKLAVEQPEAQVIPITGSFRAGDVASFADTLVRSCHLRKIETDQTILLTGVPSENCR